MLRVYISCLFVRLFELIFHVPYNSNGHVGTLPPFYGIFNQPTLGCYDTQNALHKYNHPTKPIRLICMPHWLSWVVIYEADFVLC